MKRALTRMLFMTMFVVILIGIIPFSASASTNSYKTSVFSFLTKEMKLNSAAACGIMANIERESNFDPTEVYYDSNGRLSGGLCQWNGGRFSNLKNYCSRNNLDWRSVKGQMSYLKAELSLDYYSHIYDYLKHVPNTKSGAYDAAWYWCYYFEIPSNRSVKADQRGSIAQSSYWPAYGPKTIQKPALKLNNKNTVYDLGTNIKVSWTSDGKNIDGFKLYMSKQNPKTGKYEYTSIKNIKVNAKTRSYTINTKYLPLGNYKFCVYAYDNETNVNKQSNVIAFSVKCLTHSNTSKVTKIPTKLLAGKINYKCKQCGYSVTKALTFEKYFESLKVSNIKLQKVTSKTASIKWDKLNYADGYRIYMKTDKWSRVATVNSNINTYTIKNLKPNQTYCFAVKAYSKLENKNVFNKPYNTVKTKTPKAASP